MTDKIDRRPLASRDTGWARAVTRRLVATAITPNQISMASMVAAALAGGAFWALAATDGAQGATRVACLLVAALGCQLRLLCNLFDGLVAVEGGKHAPDGPFWNEFPDRISDILILVGLGLGAGLPALGWAAAALAVLTAYTRELGRACGAPADYSGPMAKPQRMALVTVAALVALAEPLWQGGGEVLTGALWLLVVGTGATVLRRAGRLVGHLRTGGA